LSRCETYAVFKNQILDQPGTPFAIVFLAMPEQFEVRRMLPRAALSLGKFIAVWRPGA